MQKLKVGYIIGSLAKGSINRKLANALVKLAPAQLAMHEIGFGELPIYSYDYDASYPEVATRFKEAIAASDAILFVTPEYNRSIPGGLKNAIDWATRPWGQNAFKRMPCAVIGASPGNISTAVAQTHLRSILIFCSAPIMTTVEAYIHFTKDLIGDDGTVANAGTEEFLRNYMEEFRGFIERVHTALGRTSLGAAS